MTGEALFQHRERCDSNVAIIPARGGSKRIPRKNIIDFGGKPMIAHSIHAARMTGLFSDVIVSTDDEEIAGIARQYGASVPFMRPAALANDYVGTDEVVANALTWLEANGNRFDNACCIYATAPFIQPRYLIEGYDRLSKGAWQYVFSAGMADFPVFRSFVKIDGEGLQMLYPEHTSTRSQDLPPVFYDAGQFYWGRRQAWLDGLATFARWSTIVLLPRERVHDIDTIEDLRAAQSQFEMMARTIL